MSIREKGAGKPSALQTIKTYGIKSVFFRYFFSSLLIVFLVILPLTAVLTMYYKFAATKEISELAMESTIKSKDIFDVLTTDFFKSYHISCNNSAIQHFLDADEVTGLNGYTLVNDVYDAVLPLIKSSDYVDDIFIYSTRSQFMASSRSQKKVLPDLKPEWLKTYDALQLSYFMIPRRTDGSKTYNTLYTCQVIYDRGRVAGLFGTEVRYNRFEELVRKAFSENPSKMYIVSDIGLILYCDDPSRINTSIYMDKNAMPLFTPKDPPEQGTQIQGDYIISLAKSDDSHIYVLSYLDRTQFMTDLSSELFIMILISAGSFLVAVSIAAIFSWRHYKSITYVMNSLRAPDETHNLPKAVSELYNITSTIIALSHNNQTITNELAQKAAALRDAQIAALQAQINPHFLFNALQLISLSIIREVRADNAATGLISDLSALLRTTYDTENYIIPIAEEIAITKKYLAIQQARYNKRLSVCFDVEEACLPIHTVKLTLQPLVENSILHGFKGKEGNWNIIVRVSLSGKNVILQVIDNGIGMEPEILEKICRPVNPLSISRRESIGVTNVYQRIRLVYGQAADLSILSSPDTGTMVSILHPVSDPVGSYGITFPSSVEKQ